MDRGAWQATIQRATKCWTMTEWLSTHTHSKNYETLVKKKKMKITQEGGKWTPLRNKKIFWNDNTIQGNLQIKCNSYQNTNGIFHRTGTNHFENCMEMQRIFDSQSILEKLELSWRYHGPWLQTILWSYSNQTSMILAQKLTKRLMEQNRDPRNTRMHLWSARVLALAGSRGILRMNGIAKRET